MDNTLFIKHSSLGKVTTLIVYVDNIVLTRNDNEEIQKLNKYLATELEIKKNLGNLKYFLGIEVARSRHCIFLSKQKYVLDLPGVHLRNVEGGALEDYLLPLLPQLPLPPSLPTTSFSFYSIPTPPYKPSPNSLPSHLSSSLGLPSSFTSGWWTHEFTDDKT
jgi:hypothetical protein